MRKIAHFHVAAVIKFRLKFLKLQSCWHPPKEFGKESDFNLFFSRKTSVMKNSLNISIRLEECHNFGHSCSLQFNVIIYFGEVWIELCMEGAVCIPSGMRADGGISLNSDLNA